MIVTSLVSVAQNFLQNCTCLWYLKKYDTNRTSFIYISNRDHCAHIERDCVRQKTSMTLLHNMFTTFHGTDRNIVCRLFKMLQLWPSFDAKPSQMIQCMA
jgi:hypothetical protein